MKRLVVLLCVLCLGMGAWAQLPAEISLAQTAGFEGAHVQRFYGPEPMGILGGSSAIAFGNIDGDAYDDLIVGVPEYGESAGIVYVIYGAPGFTAFEYALEADPLADVRMTLIYGEQGRVGESVAAGDVDGDGFDDVVIGAPGANVPGVLGAGACVVVYGSAAMPGQAQGIGTTVTLDIDNGTVPSGITCYYGIDPGDECGQSVAAGDFTNDGRADVAVGAPGAIVTANAGAGEAYIFNSSLDRRGTGVNANGNPSTDRWYKLYGGSASGRVGQSLAIGDINGDGYGDIAVGAPGVGGGRVFTVSGAANPVGTLLLNFSTSGFGEIAGTLNDDLFGVSVAIGNFDGDKDQDILIGAPLADGAVTDDNVGGVFMLPGRQSLLQDDFRSLGDLPGTHQDKRILGAEFGSGLGYNVAFGDVDADGRDDIIYSRRNLESSSGTAVGQFHVSYAKDLPTVLDLATTAPDVTVYGGTTDDNFGAAMAGFGDMNNDGRADFVSAATLGASPFGTQPNLSGYAAVIFGDSSEDSAFVQHGFPPGQTPMTPVGGGNLSPTFRVEARFNAGTEGYLQVEVHRTPVDIENLGPSAKEYWVLSTPRTGWSSVELTFQYTDEQIEGISPSNIKFAQAADVTGPWTELQLDNNFDKRTLNGVFTTLGVFAIYTDLPVITLDGPSELFHECGTPYTDAGATAADAEDGDLTAQLDIASTVDVQNPGIYTVAYNVSDSNSNVAQTVVRTVTVRDLTQPQLTLTGASAVFLQCGTPYNDLGATSADTCDGTLDVVVDTSTVNEDVPGAYTVNYSTTDQTGNNAQTTRSVTVVDTDAPVINIGEANITLDCNEPFIEPGFTAIDSCDGNLAASVVTIITNLGTNQTAASIDSSVAGSYRINYGVSDTNGNTSATTARFVTVVNNCDLTELACTTTLDGAQQVPAVVTAATGTATWTRVGANQVVLRITHNVQDAVMAHIHTGAPGTTGPPINNFGNPASPIIALYTIAEYNAFLATPHYINIHSVANGDGEIRGNIVCDPIGGEDGFQTSDQDQNNVISLEELLRVIQFYNSFGLHCADAPGDTEDGYAPGVGANLSCLPYDTDYDPQDWLISLQELLRLIQFYNSFGYNYCPGTGTEDDFCPGL